MRHTITLLLAGHVALAMSHVAVVSGEAAAVAEQTRTLYFSATDTKGAPVTDLTAAEITVKEDGKDRAVTSVTAATAPMQIAILVDDVGSGAYQAAVAQLLEATIEGAQASIKLLNPQAVTIVGYTQDIGALKTAIGRLGPRGRLMPGDDQMVEGISEVAQELLKRKAERPVIVVLTIRGESAQADNPEAALERLISSGAVLNVVSVTNSPMGRVLSEGPRVSGGRSEIVGANPAVPAAIARIVNHLKHQYVLTYTLPDGVKPNARVAVATTRRGVSLVAPSRLAVR